MSAKKLPTSGAVCFRSENRWWSLTDSQNGLTSCMWKQTMIKVQSTCTCTLTIRQTANARQRKKLRYQAIKSKWTCWFKTDIHIIILSTQERKYETKTFNENFAKKVRTCRLPFPETWSLNSLISSEKRISVPLIPMTGTKPVAMSCIPNMGIANYIFWFAFTSITLHFGACSLFWPEEKKAIIQHPKKWANLIKFLESWVMKQSHLLLKQTRDEMTSSIVPVYKMCEVSRKLSIDFAGQVVCCC
jgi:hypothetical protein